MNHLGVAQLEWEAAGCRVLEGDEHDQRLKSCTLGSPITWLTTHPTLLVRSLESVGIGLLVTFRSRSSPGAITSSVPCADRLLG